jgi:hypothetical protein
MDPESSGGGDGRNESYRPLEQPAVVTTIVGGRPPGAGLPIGTVPRGIEVLVKKAAVDAEFRLVLLDQRADAAAVIGLQLEPAEAMMLRAISREQLATIVARTNVPDTQRRTFLGQAASAMLATLGLASTSCQRASDSRTPPTTGIAPDRPHPDKSGPSNPRQAEGPGGHHE